MTRVARDPSVTTEDFGATSAAFHPGTGRAHTFTGDVAAVWRRLAAGPDELEPATSAALLHHGLVTLDGERGAGSTAAVPGLETFRGLDDVRRAFPPVERRAVSPRRPFDSTLATDLRQLAVAGLTDGPEAVAAWSSWRGGADPERLDPESLAALPSVLLRRGSVGVDPALVGVSDAFRRRTWVRWQLLLAATERLAGAFEAAAVPVVLLKGAAMLHHTGVSPSLRSMYDVDLLVPVTEVGAAAEAAATAGFEVPMLLRDAGARARVVKDLHAVGLVDGAGTGIDLHWHVLAASPHPAADEGFLRRAVAVDGRPWAVTGVEDTLLHTVVHGFGWTRRLGIRWLFDLDALLHACAPDWDVVVAEAARHRVAPVLAGGLDLAASVGVPVPEEARAEARRRGGRLHRLELGPGSSRAAAAAATVMDHVRRTTPVDRRWRLRIRRSTPEVSALAADTDHAATGPAPATFLTDGWGPPQEFGTWSRSFLPELAFALDRPEAGALRLDLEVVPLLGPGHRRLDVLVLEGRRPVTRWRFEGDGWDTARRVFALPARRRPRREVRLRFVVLLPCSPSRARLDASPDHRPLGFAVHRFAWSPTPD